MPPLFDESKVPGWAWAVEEIDDDDAGDGAAPAPLEPTRMVCFPDQEWDDDIGDVGGVGVAAGARADTARQGVDNNNDPLHVALAVLVATLMIAPLLAVCARAAQRRRKRPRLRRPPRPPSVADVTAGVSAAPQRYVAQPGLAACFWFFSLGREKKKKKKKKKKNISSTFPPNRNCEPRAIRQTGPRIAQT
jgi:hypothetical protein